MDAFVWAPTRLPTYPSERLLALLKENPPIYFRRNLENMAAIAKQHGVGLMFATFAYSPEALNDPKSICADPAFRKGIEEHNEVVKEVASQNDVPVFDFAALMPGDKKDRADGIHVNEEGALVKAGLFVEYLHARGHSPVTHVYRLFPDLR